MMIVLFIKMITTDEERRKTTTELVIHRDREREKQVGQWPTDQRGASQRIKITHITVTRLVSMSTIY